METVGVIEIIASLQIVVLAKEESLKGSFLVEPYLRAAAFLDSENPLEVLTRTVIEEGPLTMGILVVIRVGVDRTIALQLADPLAIKDIVIEHNHNHIVIDNLAIIEVVDCFPLIFYILILLFFYLEISFTFF